MGRVTKAVCNGVSFVGQKVEHFWSDHGSTIINGAIIGLAGYGAAELTWSLIGGRKFEHDIYKLEGQAEGFDQGQQNAVNIISSAKGKSCDTSTINNKA